MSGLARCRALLPLLLLSGCGGGGGGDSPTGPAPTTYTLSVGGGGNGGGSVSSTPAGIACTVTSGSNSGTCSATFNSGVSVALSATPESGSTFSGWSSGCVGSGACAVTMARAQAVQATFATVPVVQAVSLTAAPSLAVLGLGGTVTFTIEARDAANAIVSSPNVTATSRNADVASVSGLTVTARKSGTVYVVFGSGSVRDSAAVAVVAGNGYAVLLSTRADEPQVTTAPGSTLSLDFLLSRPPGGIGDIAALQGTVSWAPAALSLQGSQGLAAGWVWLANTASSSGGTMSFAAFSATGAAGDVTLARLTFTVGGAAGSNTVLTMSNLAAGNAAGADISSQVHQIATRVAIR